LREDLIRLDVVRKTYLMGAGEIRALDGVSLTIRHGEFCAIMGASGSGKSTLLNLLGCLDRPTSGRYSLDGRNVGSLDDNTLSDIRLERIGFIFQSFNLIPQLSVRENIELPLFYLGRGTEECRRRSRDMAALVGLSDRLTHRPAELSGGQQQRVAIARALANDPAVILADEPTGNLDSATGKQIMDILADLKRQGKTVVMVTHEPDIASYADRRVYMRDGRIEKTEAIS